MPLKINSNRVFKFSGLGLVTKMFEYPCASAAAMAKPRAADFPRPRPAVRVTVDESVFSAMASTNVRIAWAWSIVFASLTSSPIGLVSARLSLRSLSSDSSLLFPRSSSRGLMSFPRDMGNTFSSSSRTRQSSQEPSDRMNRSLNRATTESCAEVRYREWTSYTTH